MDLITLAKNIPDYRFDRRKVHTSEVIVYISLAAVICDAQTWRDIELFGRCKFDYFKKVFPYLESIPSHDTFNRFFSLLKPEVFEKEFRCWVKSVCKNYKGVVAIDGKTIKKAVYTEEDKMFRGSLQRAGSPGYHLHMVSAWAVDHHISLGQVKTDEKSNEITAIPQLLDALDIKGCTITIDAMGCQKKITEKIKKNKANYVLAVKKNHELLYKSMETFFEGYQWRAEKENRISVFETSKKGHGRIEKRKCIVCNNLYWLTGYKEWDGLQSFACLQTERIMPGENGAVKQTETRFYISSLPLNAEDIYKAVRSHWSIENNLHWQLDVSFSEDDDRKKNIAAQNFSLLAKTALTLLKHDTTKNNSIKTKRKGAGWDDSYLHHLLNQQINF